MYRSATKNTKIRLESYLLAWWENNKESYPFRETSDPYKVLVSEMLLRRTKRDQVAAIYHEFFEKFPDPYAIMNSSPEEIAGIIKPLGLINRAAQIFEICSTICKERAGTIPSDQKELIALPGVGRYIANVVLTMGFGKPKPMIDTNIRRVLSRILGMKSCSRRESREKIYRVYENILPKDAYREFHFAMIDLAHQLCVPRNPLCSQCPVDTLCYYSS